MIVEESIVLIGNEIAIDEKVIWDLYTVSIMFVSAEVGFKLMYKGLMFMTRSIVGHSD